ncbi:TPA: hypothetical protein ACH3X2_012577 [Trebouxia sp. C0005]
MEHSLTDAEETVNAVLEEVLDDAQHWRSPGLHEDQDLTLSAEHSEQRMQTQLQDSRKVTTDQAVTTPADGSGTNDPDTATAMATLCQIAPVQSAMNPLFQPAQLVRPQSAQLQHTLSSMKRQLSALENSMQQPPGIEADGDPLASSTADVPLDASSAATAGASNAAMARADAAVTSNTAGTSSLAAPVQVMPDVPALSSSAISVRPALAGAATAAEDATAADLLTAAAIAAAGPATAAAGPATVADAAASMWAPPPPHIPAMHPVAPRRSSAFRHSMSAMPHKSSLMHSSMTHSRPQSSRCGNPLGHDRDAAQLEAGPVDIPGLSKGTRDEIRWSRRSKDAVWQRPVTAGQVRLPIGLQEQHHAAQQSRPQTAVAARQEWPVSRLGLELQGHMPWMQEGIQGSVERPSSPVRERMKHAVERESCLRLEAEMAALDVGELLHQKAAAEGAAQAEAAKNAELQQQMAQVKEELHAARRDASRQHARELQLDLTQAHMANAALRLQLDEAQMEVTAEHERSKAAESALEAQRRERRAAEYVCSRPASPHRDAALHAELANLRLQVAELTGRLQHAEQTHTDLLTQIRSSPLQPQLQPPASSDTHVPANQATLAYTAAGGGASLAALQGQTVNVNGASKSSQRQDCSGNGEEDEHRQRTDQAMGSHSPPASHDSSSAGTATQLTQQQQQQQDDSPLPENTSRLSQPSAPASDSHMESQLTRSSSALQKTLADLAESLTMDVTKLKGLLDCSEADGTMSKVANWGFPKHEAGDSPGPSRPVTATPCDNMQRPNRQWSAGPTRHEAYRQQAGDAGQQRQSRPMTATIHGRFAHDAVGMSLVDAAGRRSGVVPNRRSGQGKQADMWIDPVPPTRMPEEILQQAREDYMKEKKRVRDKRLQELAAKAGDMTNAASQ